MRPETILLLGGGTGGHVFPLIAVADELRRLAPAARLVFVGTERGIESQVVPARGYTLELVESQPIRGRGLWGGFNGVGVAVRAVPRARALIERLSPKVVFSIGGYAAGPVSLAARLAGIPLALMEPNSVVGLANRLIAPWVQRAYTCFAEVERHFPAATVLRAGVAIRRGFDPQEYTFDGKRPLRVLVLGGSQGAQSLNETVPKALLQCRTRLEIVHQAGKGHDREVRSLYQQLQQPSAPQVPIEVVPFISDVPSALKDADLVIGRSGAGAVAEICAVGRPALFIPYPYASGDHQFKNAQSLVRQRAALCLRAKEANAASIALKVDELGSSPERLAQMARAAQVLGKPDAAEVVAHDLLELGNVQIGSHDPDLEVGDEGHSSPLPSEVH
ncbi:MAG TPA: undecaprenyldiphospho-muramoylpentapeptide beta-N-acetylglucosaminyltransferase [Polyangiaceae bacterium]|nr:undecaprenyldiphospho-muramoylpentapeptide beta-N-acetylglucosaminyltransferase [Polyangiaceae bacterium]